MTALKKLLVEFLDGDRECLRCTSWTVEDRCLRVVMPDREAWIPLTAVRLFHEEA